VSEIQITFNKKRKLSILAGRLNDRKLEDGLHQHGKKKYLTDYQKNLQVIKIF